MPRTGDRPRFALWRVPESWWSPFAAWLHPTWRWPSASRCHGSFLFLPDALSYFLQHVHCFGVNRSVLVDAEIDRYRAAILHALTNVITESLPIELRPGHFHLLLNPVWFHDQQGLISQPLSGAAGVGAVDWQGDGAGRLSRPVVLPFGDVWINPRVHSDDPIGIPGLAHLIEIAEGKIRVLFEALIEPVKPISGDLVPIAVSKLLEDV